LLNCLILSRLDKNDLDCDCNLYWLWQHVFEVESARNHRKFELFARCGSPYHHKGKNLINMDKNDFQCSRLSKDLSSLIRNFKEFLIRIFFIEAPIIVEYPKDVEIKIDKINSKKEVFFVCNISGNPLPSIQWSKMKFDHLFIYYMFHLFMI
jgi:hypothetical protein